MSTVGGPEIESNGLVLYLNAVDPNSLVPGSTNWIDVVARKISCPMFNSIAFSSNNGGYLAMDGSDDYVNFYAPNLSTTTTVEMWCRIKELYSNNMFFGWNRYDVWCGNGNLGFNTSGGDVYGIGPTEVQNLGLVNNWKHYVFEMRSDVSYSNNKIYVNTISQSLSQRQGSEDSSVRNYNNGYGRIAGWLATDQYRMPMDLSVFKVYNRALTQAEINENFNYFKKRYSI